MAEESHRTRPEEAYAARWHAVRPGLWCAYLWDKPKDLWARMSWSDVHVWCDFFGARMGTHDEIDAVRCTAARLLVPVTLPTGDMIRAAGLGGDLPAINAYRSAHMRDLAWSREHDRLVGTLDPDELVFNLGKHWTGTPGQLMGWYVQNRAVYGGHEGPGYVQAGTGVSHNTEHVDYSMIPLVFRDEAPPRPSWFERLKSDADEVLERAGRRVAALFSAPPPGDPTLGERAVVWSRSRVGLHEIPGPTHNAEIVAWGALCRRGGVYLGRDEDGDLWSGTARPVASPTDEEAWCAKFASAALHQALRPHETPPHGLRVAVAELVTDARALGTWRDVSTGYTPKMGDLAIFARGGEDPRSGGKGHVARVTIPPTLLGDFETIGGNESPGPGQVHVTPRKKADPSLVGWIVY